MVYHAKEEMSIERVVMGFSDSVLVSMNPRSDLRTVFCRDCLDIEGRVCGRHRQVLCRNET